MSTATVPHTATVASLIAPGSPRRRRAGTVSIVLAVALVLAWLTATLIWRDGWSRPTRGDAVLLPPLVFIVAALANHVRIYLRRRPVVFEVRDGAFIAPPADRLSAATAMLALATAAIGTGILLMPPSTDTYGGLLVGGYIGVTLVVVTFLARLVMRSRNVGRILLHPGGLRITYSYGSREVPWEAVSAGPPRTGGLLEPTMRIGRPELLRGTGLARRQPAKVYLPASESWILREFLADAVNYYLATPGARHTIGTEDGYTHLRRVLRAG